MTLEQFFQHLLNQRFESSADDLPTELLLDQPRMKASFREVIATLFSEDKNMLHICIERHLYRSIIKMLATKPLNLYNFLTDCDLDKFNPLQLLVSKLNEAEPNETGLQALRAMLNAMLAELKADQVLELINAIPSQCYQHSFAVVKMLISCREKAHEIKHHNSDAMFAMSVAITPSPLDFVYRTLSLKHNALRTANPVSIVKAPIRPQVYTPYAQVQQPIQPEGERCSTPSSNSAFPKTATFQRTEGFILPANK